jgi:hypothetical protein
MWQRECLLPCSSESLAFPSLSKDVKTKIEKLHNINIFVWVLYSSPSIVRVIKARRVRWEGHVARMEEVRGAYKILVGKPEGRTPLGRPGRRREDNIKMDLGEIGFGVVDWIHLAQE